MSESTGAALLGTAIVFAVTAAVYVVARWIGNRFVSRFKERGPETGARVATLWLMIRRVILAVLIIVVGLMTLDLWGISLAPFLAVGTIAGVAIGFGAQDVVKDLLAGFLILAEDQYHIGDTVTIADATGTGEDIQFRVTVLRDLEGTVHFVPNGQITVTSNYTRVFGRPVLNVGIAYSEDVDRAMEVMHDELSKLATDDEWSSKIGGPVEMMGVQSLGDSSVVLRARLTTMAEERWSVRREALRRLKNRFDAEGIEIPFPQLTIHHRDE